MAKYNPSKIEKKWQKWWETNKLHQAQDFSGGKKNYLLLVEFPYPSGDLHTGHWYAFSVPDIYGRYLSMNGYNVMYPIGFDAFGLPAERAAVKRGIHPKDWTTKNIKNMTKQLQSMGARFDMSRIVSTIDPEYYKWTQWIFLQLYKAGLAYRAKTAANWCPHDKTVLANEQVIDGKCDRCGTQVVQREVEQWMFKITSFADRLVDDIKELDWPESAKKAQENWIGRSEGAKIKFLVKDQSEEHAVEVFTTRPDTIFGATFLVVSPELAQKWIKMGWQASEEVKSYIEQSFKKTDLQRQEDTKEKTGVPAGFGAINPMTEQEIPIWVADYVLGHYGTGAIMAVPSHDERDMAFAQKFNLPVKEIELEDPKKIIDILKEKGLGEAQKNYRLHDWLLSRQRYWGAPIPMIKCAECGYVAVPEDKLPVKLPSLDNYLPADDGRSPLAKAEKWLKVKCPQCGKPAERETDTMDTFVDSSWYYLRYADPKNKEEFASKAKMANWLPVPLYFGGAEHNTMHLLYSRFITKALRSLNLVDFSEPFLSRRNHGFIMDSTTGQKMSKSKGQAIDPDIEVKKFGADAVRMYFAFLGPYDQNYDWNSDGLVGVRRFLDRIWDFVSEYGNKKAVLIGNKEVDVAIHRAIKEVGEQIRQHKFNTGVSALMKLLNELEKVSVGGKISKEQYELVLKLVAPYAPHITDELWVNVLGNEASIHATRWPEVDESLLATQEIKLMIQVNGRVRSSISAKPGLSEEDAKALAIADPATQKHLTGDIKKIIYVPDKLINIVV